VQRPEASLQLSVGPAKTIDDPTIGLGDTSLTADTTRKMAFDVQVATLADVGFKNAKVELRDPDGQSVDASSTDDDGIAHFKTVLPQPGTWHLGVIVEDADRDAAIGYEDVKVVNRKGATFTDLNGAGWAAQNGHYRNPTPASVRAAKTGGPVHPLSKTEGQQLDSIVGELNRMAAGMLSLFGGCHDLACVAARFQGTPAQQQSALTAFQDIVIELQTAAGRRCLQCLERYGDVLSLVTVGGNGALGYAPASFTDAGVFTFDGKGLKSTTEKLLDPHAGALAVTKGQFRIFADGAFSTSRAAATSSAPTAPGSSATTARTTRR